MVFSPQTTSQMELLSEPTPPALMKFWLSAAVSEL
jgi:hypothetical protein